MRYGIWISTWVSIYSSAFSRRTEIQKSAVFFPILLRFGIRRPDWWKSPTLKRSNTFEKFSILYQSMSVQWVCELRKPWAFLHSFSLLLEDLKSEATRILSLVSSDKFWHFKVFQINDPAVIPTTTLAYIHNYYWKSIFYSLLNCTWCKRLDCRYLTSWHFDLFHDWAALSRLLHSWSLLTDTIQRGSLTNKDINSLIWITKSWLVKGR